jgi:hypothetical protein
VEGNNVQRIINSILGAGATLAVLATDALANNGRGNGPPPHAKGNGPPPHSNAGGNAPGAPEIDVSQGAAALVIVALVVLVLREIYLRRRAAA